MFHPLLSAKAHPEASPELGGSRLRILIGVAINIRGTLLASRWQPPRSPLPDGGSPVGPRGLVNTVPFWVPHHGPPPKSTPRVTLNPKGMSRGWRGVLLEKARKVGQVGSCLGPAARGRQMCRRQSGALARGPGARGGRCHSSGPRMPWQPQLGLCSGAGCWARLVLPEWARGLASGAEGSGPSSQDR